MIFQAQLLCNTLMDRLLIDTYVDVARLLSRGVPALTLVQQLEVSASRNGSPNRNCHSKDYRSMVFQAQLLCNTLMDRVMIDRSVGVARLLTRGVPAPSLVQQLEVSASRNGSPNRNCHSKNYRSMDFQAQLLCNNLMDKSMIGTYGDVARFVQVYRSNLKFQHQPVPQIEIFISRKTNSSDNLLQKDKNLDLLQKNNKILDSLQESE
jgi:hypothetical protein